MTENKYSWLNGVFNGLIRTGDWAGAKQVIISKLEAEKAEELEKLSEKAETHETPIYGVTNRQIQNQIKKLRKKANNGT